MRINAATAFPSIADKPIGSRQPCRTVLHDPVGFVFDTTTTAIPAPTIHVIEKDHRLDVAANALAISWQPLRSLSKQATGAESKLLPGASATGAKRKGRSVEFFGPGLFYGYVVVNTVDTLVATTVAPKWSKTMLVGIDKKKSNDARLFVSVSTPFLPVPDSAIEVATRPRIDTFDFPCGVAERLDDDERHRFAFDVATIVVPKWPTRR